MFKAIVSADTLKTTLDSVSVLVDECKIHLEEDGLEIRAVDPANVGMVDLSLSADAFESYEADGGLIGVNLSRLEDIAGMADAGQLVSLELDEETRKLHIQIDGLEYTLTLIDPDSIRQEPDIPDLDLAAEGDADDVHLELDRDDLIDLTAADAHSLFSLDYLKDMDKAIPKDAEVTMELGEEFPVKMHFDIAEGMGHVTFMLAPRIQSN